MLYSTRTTRIAGPREALCGNGMMQEEKESRKGNKAIGKKIYSVKKKCYIKKQNKTTLTKKKKNEKEKTEKKRKRRVSSTQIRIRDLVVLVSVWTTTS